MLTDWLKVFTYDYAYAYVNHAPTEHSRRTQGFDILMLNYVFAYVRPSSLARHKFPMFMLLLIAKVASGSLSRSLFKLG